MTVQEEMRMLISQHCETLKGEAAAVRSCVDRLGQTTADAVAILDEGMKSAHKIKGSSGTIGFLDVSEVAADLEFKLRELFEAGQPPVRDAVAALAELCGELLQRVERLRPEDSTLYDFGSEEKVA